MPAIDPPAFPADGAGSMLTDRGFANTATRQEGVHPEMVVRGLERYKGKRILMLQGPLGPFFARLASDMRLAGADVYKVNFNGGDWLFALGGGWREVSNFTGSIDEWPSLFSSLLTRLNIDTVFLFGDCRPVHVPALTIARQRGVEVGVFEEGYLRPDYITLERGGVNSRSSLPNNPFFYLSQSLDPIPPTSPVGSTFGMAAVWAILYYTAATVGKPIFRHYWHHRPLGIMEGIWWLRSFARKVRHRHREASVSRLLLEEASSRFFLVPLQTCGDAQIKVHSPFRSIPRFIDHVMRSFARNAPGDCLLVIKHHPLDRGYSDYTNLIERLAKRYRLESRCHYIHDQHLPSLLKKAQGVVVVNSTVGLSAVGEGVPVKVCGKALYDIRGLTFQGDLDSFWDGTARFSPDMNLWRAFRHYLIVQTQFNGSFYRKLSSTGYETGVAWGTGLSDLEIQTTVPMPERLATVEALQAMPTPTAASPAGVVEELLHRSAEMPVADLATAG